jgi:hypothetical protein
LIPETSRELSEFARNVEANFAARLCGRTLDQLRALLMGDDWSTQLVGDVDPISLPKNPNPEVLFPCLRMYLCLNV